MLQKYDLRKTFISFLILIMSVMVMTINVRAKDDYPERFKQYKYGSAIGDDWGMYVRECTSFVAFRLASTNGLTKFHNSSYKADWSARWGNAGNWGSKAKSVGIKVDMNPKVGSVAWTTAGPYGHVAWVKSVSGNKVTVEEYNFVSETNGWQSGCYNERTVDKTAFTGYIHFADIPKVEICEKKNGKYIPVKDLTLYMTKVKILNKSVYKPILKSLYVLVDGKVDVSASVKSTNSKVVSHTIQTIFCKKPGNATLSVSKKIPNTKKNVTASVNVRIREIVTDIGYKKSSMAVGVKGQFFPTVVGPSKKVSWKCSNKKVFKLNTKTGEYEALKEGEAVVTLKANGVTSTCKITVKEKPVITLNKNAEDLFVGKSMKLTVKTKGLAGKITWSSSDRKVAVVDQSGKVTAKGAGTAVITVRRSLQKAQCTVNVKYWDQNVDLMDLLGKKYAKISYMVPRMKKWAPGYYGEGKASITFITGEIVVVEMMGVQNGYNIRGIYCGMNYASAADLLIRKGFKLEVDASVGDSWGRYYSNGKESIQINSDDMKTVTYIHGTLD